MFEKLKAGFKHAFAVEPPDYKYSEEETRIVDKVADFIVKRQMTTPAIFFAKSSAPLNMLASQLLVFLKPFATFVFNKDEYKKFAEILEHRNSIEFLVTRIEEAERRLHRKLDKSNREEAEKQVGERT